MRSKDIIQGLAISVLVFSGFFFINTLSVQGYKPGFRTNWTFIDRFIDIDTEPLMIDLDLDSIDEILFTSGNKLYCVSELGEIEWYDDEKNLPSVSLVSAANILHDEKLEVLYSFGPRLFACDYDGYDRWAYTFNDYVTSKATASDIYNNGLAEILVACDDGKLYCLSCFGDQIWNFTLSSSFDMEYITIHTFDFDGDDYKEIIIGGGPLSEKIYCLNYNGTIRWEKSFGFVSQSVLADITNDGIPEIIASTSDGYIIALNSNGSVLWSFLAQYFYAEKPVIADITGDGISEVLFMIYNIFGLSKLYCLSSQGEHQWNISVGDISNDEITVADIDLDGTVEMLYCTFSEGIVCLDNTTKKLASYKPDATYTTRHKIIVYDYLNDSNMDLLFASNIGLYSLRTFNKNLFYGLYLLPVYITSVGVLAISIILIDKGFKTGKLKLKPKTYKYVNEDGQEIYFEKE